MNIYIIGPVTGMPGGNRKEFERVRLELWRNPALGCVRIPHDYVSADASWEQAMHQSLLDIMQWWGYGLNPYAPRQSLGIAMLDGWEQSKGANIEHDLATALGIPCKPWREWL